MLSDSAEVREWQRLEWRVLGPFTFDHKAYLLPAGQEQLALRIDEWLVAREADGWLDGQRHAVAGPGGEHGLGGGGPRGDARRADPPTPRRDAIGGGGQAHGRAATRG